MDYYQHKARQLEAATESSVTLTGTVVSVPEDHPFMRGGFRPVMLCACVTEPCPCDGYDHGNTILWIPDALTLTSRDTGRHSTGGDSIIEYQLDTDTSVLLETLRPVRAGAARAVLEAAQGCGAVRG